MGKMKMPFCEMPQIDRSGGEDAVREHLYAMDITDFPNLFSDYALSDLQNAGLNKIESVIRVINTDRLSCYTTSFNAYDEIIAAIKLIKCEYFDKMPGIAEGENIYIQCLCTELGLSVNATYVLTSCKTLDWSKDLFFIMRDPNAIDILTHIPGFAKEERAWKEILEKASIVMRYYDRMKAKETGEEGLPSLNISTSVISDHQSEKEQQPLSDIDTLKGLQKRLIRFETLSKELSDAIAETKALIDEKIKEGPTKGAI